MEIYYIANARIPTEKAHGHQILQMCQAFQENKIKIKLLIPWRRNTKELKQYENKIEEYYHLREKIEVVKVPSFDFMFLINIGRKWLPIPYLVEFAANFLHTISFAFFLSLYLNFALLRKKNLFFYIRDINLASFLSFFLPKKAKRKLNLELHSFSEIPWRKQRQMAILKRMGSVIAMTHFMEKEIQKYSSKIPVITAHDAVDLSLFDLPLSKEEARKELKLPQEEIIALYSGRFHTNNVEKGIPEIILAAKELLPHWSNLKFYIMGGPMDRVKNYEALIEREQMPRASFVFKDKQPFHQVPLYLKAADLLLTPFPFVDHFAYYMSPLKLFEYMAAKRPIVGTRLPSLEEVLHDQENAFLARPSDAISLANVINTVLQDRDKSEQVALKAFEDVKAYTWDGRAKKIKAFLNSSSEIKG